MSPERTRRHRKANKVRAWCIGVAIVAVPAVVLVALFMWQRSADDRFALGPDLCGKNNVLQKHTVLLIDRTDAFSVPQKAYVTDLILSIKKSLDTFERFSIYTISDGERNIPSLAFSLCNPGTAADANPWLQTPASAQSLFEQKFAKPLELLVGQLEPEHSSGRSPIMEAVQYLATISFFDQRVPQRKLIIISDMIQNSEFSQYAAPVSFEAFRHSDVGRRLESNLGSVQVDVHYLPRPTVQRVQGVVHQNFWKAYFRAGGASARFVSIEEPFSSWGQKNLQPTE